MLGPIELILIIVIPILVIISIASRGEKEYKVLKHHTDGYKAVKVGLAWVAGTVFMPIWFLFRGLWSYFFLYLILLVVAVSVDYELYGEFGSIDFNNASDAEWIWLGIQIIVAFIPLFKGNDWTAKNLIKKGYLFQDSVHAISKKNAIALVLESAAKSNNIKAYKEEGNTSPISIQTDRKEDDAPKEDLYDRLSKAYSSRTHAIVKMSLITYFIYAVFVSVASEINYHFGILIALVGLFFLIGESYKK